MVPNRKGEAVTFYCQDCGAVMDIVGDPLKLESASLIACPVCRAVFRKGQMTLDEFIAWLSFPPAPSAA